MTAFILRGSQNCRLVATLNSIFPCGVKMRGVAFKFHGETFMALDCQGLKADAVSVIWNAVRDTTTPANVQQMASQHGLLWVPDYWIIPGVSNA